MKQNQKTIYLHIGTPKTATSSIQRFLVDNNEVLKAIGYNYVDLFLEKAQQVMKEEFGFKTFPLYLMNGVVLEKLIEKEVNINDILSFYCKHSTYDKLIISSETLSAKHLTLKSLINSLKDLDNNLFKVKVILYLRPVSEYASSFWRTNVLDNDNEASTRSLEEDVLMKASEAKKVGLSILEFSDVLDKVDLEVSTFEKEVFKNGDIIEDFLQKIDITDNYNLFNQVGKVNETEDRDIVEMLLFANKLGIRKKYVNQIEYHNDLVTKELLLSDVFKISHPVKPSSTLDDEIIKKITDDLYPVHCEIAKMFLNRDELFLNKYPKIYGKEREPYKGIDIDLFQKFTNFLVDNKEELFGNSIEKIIISELHKFRQEIKEDSFKRKSEKLFCNLLCCFIPNRESRAKVRKQGFKVINRFCGKLVGAIIPSKKLRSVVRKQIMKI